MTIAGRRSDSYRLDDFSTTDMIRLLIEVSVKDATSVREGPPLPEGIGRFIQEADGHALKKIMWATTARLDGLTPSRTA